MPDAMRSQYTTLRHEVHIPHPFSRVYDGFSGSALKLNLESHREP